MTLRAHLEGSVFAEHLSGRSPSVLSLHGWGRDRTDLLPVLAGREVVAVDLPGFGASPTPPCPWGSAEYARAVADLAIETGRGPFLVVAHSFGGRVAAHLAAEHAELCTGVVFAGVPLLRSATANKSPGFYRLARAAARHHLISDRSLDTLRRRYGSVDYNSVTGVMRDVFLRVVNEDYHYQLSRITCPVGFCWGAMDSAAPPVIAFEAATIVAVTASVEVVAGVGHDVHREAPQVLRKVIDAVADAAL